MPDIKDIKPLIDIPDLSLYGVVFFTLVIAIVLIVTVYNILYKFLHDKKRRIRKAVLKRLKEVDFSNPKKAAYEITKYGRYLVHDDKSKKVFDEILPLLEKYKYKKRVDEKLSRKVIRYYYLLVEAVDD